MECPWTNSQPGSYTEFHPHGKLLNCKQTLSRYNYTGNNGKTQYLPNCASDEWLSVTPANQRNAVGIKGPCEITHNWRYDAVRQ